jgi:hypothetical protein
MIIATGDSPHNSHIYNGKFLKAAAFYWTGLAWSNFAEPFISKPNPSAGPGRNDTRPTALDLKKAHCSICATRIIRDIKCKGTRNQ